MSAKVTCGCGVGQACARGDCSGTPEVSSLPPNAPQGETNTCAVNTDREIWRKFPDDYYSPSIHVTQGGGIGMNVGGTVIVMPVESWFELADKHIKKKLAPLPPPQARTPPREIMLLIDELGVKAAMVEHVSDYGTEATGRRGREILYGLNKVRDYILAGAESAPQEAGALAEKVQSWVFLSQKDGLGGKDYYIRTPEGDIDCPNKAAQELVHELYAFVYKLRAAGWLTQLAIRLKTERDTPKESRKP